MDVEHRIEVEYRLSFKSLKTQKHQLFVYAMTDKIESFNLLLIIALKLNSKFRKHKALKKELK
jgi:hypothetical protein